MPSSDSYNQQTTADSIIVGGGIIGLSIARELVLAGLKNVVIVERGRLGAEASFAAAGMLAPQAEADIADDFFRLACKSRDMYPTFVRTLQDETGIDVELDTTGTLYLGFTSEDEHELTHRQTWQVESGLLVETLSPAEARRLEPCIAENVRMALRFPLDLQVENRRLLTALIEAVQSLNVKLVTETPVTKLLIENGSVAGVETARGKISSRRIILASGAWTSLLKTTDKRIPDLNIEPVRGQMVCLEARPRLARHVIYSPRGYLVPRMDGRVLAGSTSEEAGFDRSVTAGGLHSILARALEISPAILNLPVLDTWAGLRPRAADSLPVLGPCGEIRGLIYATGHYRNGILLAPVTAALVSAAITTTQTLPELKIFSPDRFAPMSSATITN